MQERHVRGIVQTWLWSAALPLSRTPGAGPRGQRRALLLLSSIRTDAARPVLNAQSCSKQGRPAACGRERPGAAASRLAGAGPAAASCVVQREHHAQGGRPCRSVPGARAALSSGGSQAGAQCLPLSPPLAPPRRLHLHGPPRSRGSRPSRASRHSDVSASPSSCAGERSRLFGAHGIRVAHPHCPAQSYFRVPNLNFICRSPFALSHCWPTTGVVKGG